MIRHIEFANVCNFRDIGGYTAMDGRTVRWQRLYRADSLGLLAGDDLTAFQALRVRNVIDLRHQSEIDRNGRVPEAEGRHYHHLPIEGRPWDVDSYDTRTDLARWLADRYLELSEDRVDNLRTALETIARADNAPVVVHCAAGKDRTGVITALVLALAGVSEDDIVADYALTGLSTERFIAGWRLRHGDVALWPGFGLAPPDAMRFFLADLATRHGSVEKYVTQELALSADVVAELRAHLLTEPTTQG